MIKFSKDLNLIFNTVHLSIIKKSLSIGEAFNFKLKILYCCEIITDLVTTLLFEINFIK